MTPVQRGMRPSQGCTAPWWRAGLRADFQDPTNSPTGSPLPHRVTILPGPRTASQSQVCCKEHGTVRETGGQVRGSLLRPSTEQLVPCCHLYPNCTRQDGKSRGKGLVILGLGNGQDGGPIPKEEGRVGWDRPTSLNLRNYSLCCYHATQEASETCGVCVFGLEAQFHYVVQAGLELSVSLPL